MITNANMLWIITDNDKTGNKVKEMVEFYTC